MPAKGHFYRKICVQYLNSYSRLLAEKPEDRAICNVDGKEYRDGEYFSVESDPDLNCVCQPGYEGKDLGRFEFFSV